MYDRNKGFYIIIPRDLVRGKIENSKDRSGILLAYCWMKRFGTIDGLFEGQMIQICQRMNLYYDKSKKKALPKQIASFITGIDYLIKAGIIELIKGDYHNMSDYFQIKFILLKCDVFVAMNIKYFDFVLKNEKRINKSYLLYLLLFVLSCYTIMEIDGKKCNVCACSYSLKYISQETGLSISSIFKYLNQLSKKGKSSSNAPLIKSSQWYTKIDDNIYNFPNIYVENDDNASTIIRYQKHFIRSLLIKGELKSSEYFDDYDLF